MDSGLVLRTPRNDESQVRARRIAAKDEFTFSPATD